MAKPPCNFVIVQTGPNAQGEYTFSTNPPFPNCEVHIAVNGEAAGSHMGDDVGDVHIEQLGHDSVTVRRLKDNFHVVIEITVECVNCGPTTVRRESGPGPARPQAAFSSRYPSRAFFFHNLAHSSNMGWTPGTLEENQSIVLSREKCNVSVAEIFS